MISSIYHKKPLYFDYQASTPLHPNILDAMLPFWKENFGNPHSSDHIIGWNANKAVDAARQKVATLIGADANEVIFTSGATEANNLAILGSCLGAAKRASRNTILVSSIEHKSVLESAKYLARTHGYELDYVPVDAIGQILLDDFRSMLSERIQLVSVGLVNSEIGTIQDLDAISELCNEFGAYLHTDCAQSPSAISLNAISQKVDLLSLSGHKIYGPMGIGALYVSNSIKHKIEPLFWGGGQEFGIRPGTTPVPLCVGMGTAATLFHGNGYETIRRQISDKRDHFFNSLLRQNGSIVLNGPPLTRRHPGNVNIRFPGQDNQDILMALQPNLCASTGSACSTGIAEPSHVLRAIGLEETEARSSIRFSVGLFTTDAEVSEAVELIGEALSL